MALVCKYGKPTFFITKTFDVNCPEVTKELKTGQTPFDCTDIICRIDSETSFGKSHCTYSSDRIPKTWCTTLSYFDFDRKFRIQL